MQRIHNATLEESYDYDGAGNLTTVTNHTLGQSFSYAYDARNLRTGAQMTGSDRVEYQRDEAGQIEYVHRIRNNKLVESFTLTYNDDGQLDSILYPNRSRRNIGYDELGRVASITIEAQELKGKKWRNWGLVEQFDYRYDESGNLTHQNRYGAKTRDQWASFEYDALNRLIGANYPKNDDIEYEWDAVGNLKEKSTKSHRYGYEYNRANQLTAFDGHRLPGFGCDYDGACSSDSDDADSQLFDYQYDDNGYLLAIDSNQGTQRYDHDPLGRMTQVANPNGTFVNYGYDSRSRRITTERNRLTDDGLEAPQTLVSQYDGRQEQAQFEAGKAFRSLTLLPEQNGYGRVLHQALYDTQSSYLKASGTKGADISHLYMHHDRQGSTVLALDSGNTQAMRLGYSPFGEVFRKHNDQTFWKANSTVNANHQLGQLVPYQYTGKYTEGSTGFVQMDARWYNPHTHRFVQPDYWNLRNTHLPVEIQHELMRFTGLNTSQLLSDPS
ncbi:RHS repeat domain-containing protein [Vibrio ulleungensis]|uniref:Teneurin-like YD-shell domain-containing protein n=1 Tax=Vibrio ulleungensis TaxID=2807619 RepID=A0ABS2HG91_9VIBR|nr:hypothetical protein [Vibrio ulleungensis]